MKTEYKRDMNHNYLIFRGENSLDIDSYQVRMLVANCVPSLLKCRVQNIDGEFMIYFDITSRQSLISMYEQKKFQIEDLKLIFGGFIQVMEEMSEYLLNPEQIYLNPEYMFLDVEKKTMFFCYIPEYSQNLREQLKSLTEYILPKLDHEDSMAVMLGYSVYRRSLEESFHLEFMKEELYKVREDKNAIKEEYKSGQLPVEKKIQEDSEKAFPKYEEDTFESLSLTGKKEDKSEKNSNAKREIWKIAACYGGLLIILLGLAGLKLYGYFPWLEIEVLLLTAVVFLILGIIYLCFIKKYKSKKMTAVYREAEKDEKEFVWKQIKEEIDSGINNVKEEKIKEESYGETIILSESSVEGPATLVSREAGELATIYLQEELTVIGKLETAADAVIDIPTVSRVHAKIRKRDNEYYLTDLNSRNGTTVNGKLLKEEYQLKDQDEVDFAQARYIFLK